MKLLLLSLFVTSICSCKVAIQDFNTETLEATLYKKVYKSKDSTLLYLKVKNIDEESIYTSPLIGLTYYADTSTNMIGISFGEKFEHHAPKYKLIEIESNKYYRWTTKYDNDLDSLSIRFTIAKLQELKEHLENDKGEIDQHDYISRSTFYEFKIKN